MCDTSVPLEEIGSYLAALQITPNEQDVFARLAQRTPEWHKVRAARLTASRAGAAVGRNKHCSPSRLLREMLWKTFKGNPATRWGTEKEPVACDEFTEWINTEMMEASITGTLDKPCKGVHVWETGCVVDLDHGWLAASPDGMVDIQYEDGTQDEALLEIKCPYSKTVYPQIPKYYEDQMVLQMKCTGRTTRTYFYVWTPEGSKIEVCHWKNYAAYWENYLFPALRHFYVHLYLPRLLMKAAGMLEEGCINPIVQLPPSMKHGTSVSLVEDASICKHNAAMKEADDANVRSMHLPDCEAWSSYVHTVNMRGKPVKRSRLEKSTGPVDFQFE